MTSPDLHVITDSVVFRNHYYLLSELKAYCRSKGLPASGGKQEIAERIAHFMDTGELKQPVKKAAKASRTEPITPDSVIEESLKCSEMHRAFFKANVGKRFSFDVAFQQWLKENAGKTYREAIDAYIGIVKSKKVQQTVISKQFEYNTYIRAFFAENPSAGLQDAIQCWKHKKSQPGHNRYAEDDLEILGM